MLIDPQRYRCSWDSQRGIARLEIARVQIADAGDVECRVSNALGVASSRAALLVHQAPRLRVPPAVQRDGRIVTVRGERLALELECQAHPWPQFTIDKDGARISIDSVRHELVAHAERRLVTFSIEQLTRADSGNYRLAARNECGVDELNFELLVKELPGRPRELSHLLLDQSVCFSLRVLVFFTTFLSKSFILLIYKAAHTFAQTHSLIISYPYL